MVSNSDLIKLFGEWKVSGKQRKCKENKFVWVLHFPTDLSFSFFELEDRVELVAGELVKPLVPEQDEE